MTGQVIAFDNETNEGWILGKNNKKYSFHIGEWLSECKIVVGQKIYYEIEEDEARNIQVYKAMFSFRVDVCVVE